MKNLKSFFQTRASISPARLKALQNFCRPLGLKFKDYTLLDLAFHHRSFSNENVSHRRLNNERLEFLGDSVLGVAAASFLYEDMQENPEGDLARIKAAVVSEQTLAPIGIRFGISSMLILGHGEELSGGRNKPAIIADCMEAIIGAYYLESEYSAAEKYILSFLIPEIRAIQQDKGAKDYKTMLQEFYQKKYKACPVYELVKTEGPDHDQTFFVSVKLNGTVYGPAEGKSKKQAEQHVAQLAWDRLKKN